VLRCKLITSIILSFFTISTFAMEVYIPGDVKKTTACCVVVKTGEGRYLKILRPVPKNKDPDPFKFKITISFITESVSYAYNYWKGKVEFR
jgi:hypothetical protein